MNTDNKPQFRVQCKGKEFLLSPAHVGAIILRSLKTAVELATHQLVEEAVITVPAYFSNSQRASTKMAGKSEYNLARRYKDCRHLLAGKGKSSRKDTEVSAHGQHDWHVHERSQVTNS